jgi:hypothetical protein
MQCIRNTGSTIKRRVDIYRVKASKLRNRLSRGLLRSDM